MSARKRNDDIAGLVQRLAETDDLLVTFDKRLTRALDLASESTEAWKVTERQMAKLRLHSPAGEMPSAPAGIGADRPPPAEQPGALFAWVGWLVQAYDLAEHWPPCWYRHEGLVLQLLALRRWHVALTGELASDPTSGCSWHDALYRLNDHAAREISQTCLATHRDSPSLDPVDDDDRVSWAGADLE